MSFLKKYLFVLLLLLAVVGLRRYMWAFSSCSEWGLFFLQCSVYSLSWLVLLLKHRL